MKFTNRHRLLLLIIGTAVLASCSVVSEQSKPSTESDKRYTPEIKETTHDPSVDHLLIQPNRYLDRQKSVATAIRREFNLALAAKQAGHLDKAERTFIQLTVSEPRLSGPWVQLGDIANERAQQAKAITTQAQLLEKAAVQYHQALSINPDNYHAHNRLARVYRQQGKFELGLRHYQKAIDSWPAFAPAYKNRGILYDLYLGNKAEAIINYQLFLALMEAKATQDTALANQPSFVQQQRQIKGWVADLTRQIQQQETTIDQQKTEVAHHGR